MYTAKEIGIKISELRKQRKMTQKELAEKLFITSSAVSKWENGDATPDIYRMQKLAEIFQVSIYEFVGTTEIATAGTGCAITDDSVAEVVEKLSENQSSEDKRENSSAPVLQEKGRSRYLKTWVPVGILMLLLIFVAFFAAGRFVSGRNTEAGFAIVDKFYDEATKRIDLKEEETYEIWKMKATDKRIHTVGVIRGEDENGSYQKYKYFAYDYKSNVKEERTFEDWPGRLQFLEDGQFVYINVKEKEVSENTGSDMIYELVYCDTSGKEIKRISLAEDSSENMIEGYVYHDGIGRMIPGQDKHVYVLYRDKEYLDDVDLAKGTVTQVETNELTASVWSSFRFYMDGLPVIEQKDKMNKRFYKTVDVGTGTEGEAFTLLEQKVALPEDMTDVSGVGLTFFDGTGSGYDLVLSYDGGIYGFNVGDEAFSLILDESGSELKKYALKDIDFIDKERFVVLYQDNYNNKSHLVVLNAQGTKEEAQPVMIGTASFDHYVLALQMCEGTHNSDYNAGPAFGTSWSGEYELVIRDSTNDKEVTSYLLEEWEETLSFNESFTLNVTDYNSDGNLEVLIGQYGSSNFNFYRMYYITKDLEIGYYGKIGELMITSKEMSPILEKTDSGIVYSFYNNGSGETITREINFGALTVTEH